MTVEGSDTSRSSQHNDLLRQARLRVPSPAGPDRPMSQRELAELLTAHVFHTTTRVVPLDRHYISRIERGLRRYPTADYRAAFRAVLGVATDAEFHTGDPELDRLVIQIRAARLAAHRLEARAKRLTGKLLLLPSGRSVRDLALLDFTSEEFVREVDLSAEDLRDFFAPLT